MQDNVILPGTETVVDKGDPIKYEYVVSDMPRAVKLFTFDKTDDPNIPEKASRFVVTCSRANYPELRVKFAQAFGAFVTRINQGANDVTTGLWNDVRINPNNEKFRELLSGAYGDDTQLFVIPLKKNMRKGWLPEGGIKFVTARYLQNYPIAKGGMLNLMAGSTKTEYRSLHIDFYVSGASNNNYVDGVLGI